jgi:hypothetical protein
MKTITILPLAALALGLAACSQESTNVESTTNVVTNDINAFDESVGNDTLVDEAGNAGDLGEAAVNNG